MSETGAVAVGAYVADAIGPFGFGAKDKPVRLWVRSENSRTESALTPDQAKSLAALLADAALACELNLMEGEPDPEILALHRPNVLASARAVAAYFRQPVCIWLMNGENAQISATAPDAALYLRVDADGTTHLYDER